MRKRMTGLWRRRRRRRRSRRRRRKEGCIDCHMLWLARSRDSKDYTQPIVENLV